MLPTIIWQHPRENRKKCSIEALRNNPAFSFFTYPYRPIADEQKYIMLSLEGPILTEEDASFGLFIIDATWHYADVMAQKAPKLSTRTLPKHFVTAYPRKQTLCKDPCRGLATIEALYIAYQILKKPTQGLLDHYYWKEPFLEKNFF